MMAQCTTADRGHQDDAKASLVVKPKPKPKRWSQTGHQDYGATSCFAATQGGGQRGACAEGTVRAGGRTLQEVVHELGVATPAAEAVFLSEGEE